MKNYGILKQYIMGIMVIMCMFSFSISVQAETKEQSIVTLGEAQDLIVVFTFDTEVVDISFVSPSEGTYTSANTSKVQMESGELWSSYKISSAEAGTWKVAYDLGKNTSIQYTLVNSSSGISVDTFEKGEEVDDKLSFLVKVVTEEAISRANYAIYAVEESSASEVEVASGTLNMGSDETLQGDLSVLSSGSYTFRLEVWATDEDFEVFDAATIEGYEYVNSKTPNTIEDFKLYLNESGGLLGVDWEDFAYNGDDAYYILVEDEDGNAIYEGELLSSVKNVEVTLGTDSSAWTVYLKYQANGVWSSYNSKTITLDGMEGLWIEEGDVTGNGQIQLSYITTEQRILHIEVNDTQSSEYYIEGEGYLGLNLVAGSNTVYAIFEGEDSIFYCVDKEIYYDAYPPEIVLYEKLDGQTFAESTVHILGKVNYGTTLTMNGEEVELDENYEFDYEYALSYDENIVTIEASDSNGNGAVQVLTLYRSQDVMGIAAGGLEEYLPLLIAVMISLLLMIWAILCLKRREGKGRIQFWKFICLDVLVLGITIYATVQYVIRYQIIRSIAFLEMAETSVAQAADYLYWQSILGLVAVVAGVLGIVVLPGIIIVIKKIRS